MDPLGGLPSAEALQSRVEEQNILLEHYKAEAKQAKEKLREAQEKLAEQVKEHENIGQTRQLANQMAVILHVEKENMVYQKKEQEVLASKANNTAEMDKKFLSMKAENTKLAGENQKLKKKMDGLEGQVNDLEQQLKEMEEELKDEDEHEAIVEQYQNRIQELENETEAYKDQCNEYKKQLKEKEKMKKSVGNLEKDLIGFKERAIRAEKSIVQLKMNEMKRDSERAVEDINMTIADLESKIPVCESRGRPDMAGAFKTYCADYRSIRNQVSGSYREIQRMGENMQTQIDQGKCLRELKPLPQLKTPAPPEKEAWTFFERQPNFNDFVTPKPALPDLSKPIPPDYNLPPQLAAMFPQPNMQYAQPNQFVQPNQPMQPRHSSVQEQAHLAEERMALFDKHQQEMVKKARGTENRSNNSDQSSTSAQAIPPSLNPNQVKLLKTLVGQVNTGMAKYLGENGITDDSNLRNHCAQRVCNAAIRMAQEHETPTVNEGLLISAMTLYAQRMKAEHGITIQLAGAGAGAAGAKSKAGRAPPTAPAPQQSSPLFPKTVPPQARASSTNARARQNQMTQAQAAVDTSVLQARRLRADSRIRTPRDLQVAAVKPTTRDTQDTGVIFPETIDQKDLGDEAECTICYDSLRPTETHPDPEPCRCTTCNYQYHYACLERHLNREDTNGMCPTCQQRMISGRQFPPLG